MSRIASGLWSRDLCRAHGVCGELGVRWALPLEEPPDVLVFVKAAPFSLRVILIG